MIPVVLFSGMMIYRMASTERAAAERRLILTSRDLSMKVGNEIEASMRTAHAIAQSGSLLVGDLAGFYASLPPKLQTQPTWRTIILHGADGTPLLNSRRPFGESDLQTADVDSLNRILVEKRPVVGAVLPGPGGAVGFAVRVPVMVANQMKYVLTVVVSADAMQKLVDDPAPEHAEWVHAIIDATGTVAARSRDPEKFVGAKTTPEFRKRSGAVRDPDLLRWTTLDGEPSYSAVAPVAEFGWTAAVAVPVAVLEAPLWRSLGMITAVGILLLAVFGTLTFSYSRRLARRINAAASAAGSLAKGERPEILPSGVAEVETLRQALLSASELLQSRNAERERLLAAANAARVEAESANDAKDKFLAMLGHELRNPLGSISNGVMLLRDIVPPDPEVKELQDLVERQVGHLTRMLDDLLDTSRITRGKVSLSTEILDVRTIANEVAADFRQKFTEAARTLVVEVPKDPIWVDADKVRLTQCLANLLHNSLKFTNKGGRTMLKAAVERGEVVIIVQDDGIGIDSGLLVKLFQPFQQGPQTIDRRVGGLGLGLAVVKGLVELHGGKVEAISEGKDRGTTMRITLPKAAPPNSVERSLDAADGGKRKGRRILIVEDILDAAVSLQKLLERRGHEVRIAETGLDGVEAVESFRPDAVICDLGLPDIDGNEVCRRIMASPGHHPHMIALSGYAQESDVKNALAAGFHHHMKKPADLERLAKILDAI